MTKGHQLQRTFLHNPRVQALEVPHMRQGRNHATQLCTVHRGGDRAQNHAAGGTEAALLQILARRSGNGRPWDVQQRRVGSSSVHSFHTMSSEDVEDLDDTI